MPVRAKELVAALSQYPDDTVICISSDEEGNTISLLNLSYGVAEGYFDPQKVEFYFSSEIEDAGVSEESLEPAIILFPAD